MFLNLDALTQASKSLKKPARLLSIRQYKVLEMLLATNSMQIKDLAEAIGCPRPSVCRALDELSSQGLARRERDRHDRRKVFGIITDDGRAYAGQVLTS